MEVGMGYIIQNANVNGTLTDIRIVGNKIAALAAKIQPTDGVQIFDAQGRVTVPGLVDCHTHVDKAMLNENNPYVDGTGPEKGALTRKCKETFTVENITARAEFVLNRAIQAGTVAVRTNVDVDGIVGLKGIEALLALREKYKPLLTLQIAAFAQEGIFSDGQTPRLLEEALQMGADLVGGHTITGGEGTRHIDFIMDLAEKYGVEADFHLDESGNREHYLLPYLAERMIRSGMRNKVNGIHLCTLAALTVEERAQAMELISASGLKVTVAPTAISTRAVAPVKELLATGAIIGLGSDNVRDFFNPLGSGDIKQAALLLSYIQRFFTAQETEQIWDMLTCQGAKLLGLEQYGIEEGAVANVTVFDARTPREVIAYQSRPALLIRNGDRIDAL